MSAELPEFTAQEFGRQLEPFLVGASAGAQQELVHRLFVYYQELRRWASRLALVGAGTAREVVARHFGESLAAVPLLPRSGHLVDLGSGAGFPGMVLAAAAPTALRCTLVESRLRKTVFLRTVARRMAVRVEVLQERVEVPLSLRLPDTIDCLTARAVRLPEPVWGALCERLASSGRVLLWAGSDRPLEGRLELARVLPLPHSLRRCILDYRKP